MLRRLMVEIGNDPYLSDSVALTGGTTLQHVLLDGPRRYSEDLDLLIRVPAPGSLRDFYSAWRHVARRLGLIVNAQAHSEYPKVHLMWKLEDGSPMRVTIDLARHPANLRVGERATQRRVGMDSDWFSGSAEVYCIRPEHLAASKISACSTRAKPRDLFDLHTMREPLGISDEAVVDGFLEFYADGWTAAEGMAAAAAHAGAEYRKVVDQEKAAGFIPRSFDPAEGSRSYSGLVSKVERTRASRLRNGPGARPASPGRAPVPAPVPAPAVCGHWGKRSRKKCIEPARHKGPHRYTKRKRRR